MMENIKRILKDIEQKKKIKILYACETGSRAWGFPSPDSDFDIRFIYMHKKDWYLSLGLRKDNVEIMEGDLDITGWDLKKSFLLLKKSNAPLIERFNSPIVYFSVPGFKETFGSLIEKYYSPIAVFYHHYSLAKKFWEDIKDNEEIKLKSYFYLIRSLLSCNWIIHEKSVLPMDIAGLMKLMPSEDRMLLEDLIKLKATVGEKYLHKKDVWLQHLAERFFALAEVSKDSIKSSNNDYALLDKFFLKTLDESTDD